MNNTNSFSKVNVFLSALGVGDVSINDFDGDGDNDLLSVSKNDNTLR